MNGGTAAQERDTDHPAADAATITRRFEVGVAATIALFGIGDLVTTATAIHLSGLAVEQNTIIRWLVTTGGFEALIAAKTAATAGIITTAMWMYDDNPRLTKLALWSVAATGLFLTIHNLLAIVTLLT